MDNLLNPGTGAAETAEAESMKAAAAPAKFKDVKTLVKAYSDLEAEFTRRSARLKELEKGNKAHSPSDGTDGASSRTEEELIEAALGCERVKEAVIKDYLKTVAEPKSVPLVTGGVQVAAPRVAPKTVREAGRLAREFLKH